MELLYALACAGIPFYLIYDAVKDSKSRRKIMEEIRTDPLSSIFTLGILVGWIGWFVWLISYGHFSSGYFGLIAIASLICAGIWEKIKRSSRNA